MPDFRLLFPDLIVLKENMIPIFSSSFYFILLCVCVFFVCFFEGGGGGGSSFRLHTLTEILFIKLHEFVAYEDLCINDHAF